MVRCEECKNHRQISVKRFDELSYDKQRQLDCKNLIGDEQCDCYSKEHHLEEFKDAEYTKDDEAKG